MLELKDLQKQEDRVAQCPAGVRLGGLGPCPEGWTRFVCFSDTHGMHDMIPAKHMPPADVLRQAGAWYRCYDRNYEASFKMK